MKSRWAFLLAALAIAGCGPKENKIEVKIVKSACDTKVDPFAGVKFVRVRVSGEGLPAPLESVAAAGAGTISIPQIPAGKNRAIEVRAFDGDPTAGGKVVSVGRSLPFTVPDAVDPAAAPIAINVFLRKVNAFTPPSTATAPKDCQRMKLPRAAHTATLMNNGKVFIAGGFNFATGNQTRTPLSEVELFDPATNAFTSGPEMALSNGSVKLPKAFHTATKVGVGQILIWGGESYSGGAANTVSPSALILIYDPDANDYVAIPRKPPAPAAIPRTQHKAVVDKNGKVLVVGGLTRTTGLVPVEQVEWFDPATSEYKVVSGVMLPRAQPAVAAVKAGDLVAVAGGTDGTAMANEVVYFKWDGTGFKLQQLAQPPKLALPGRRGASAATLRAGLDLLVLGGYSDPDPAKVAPIASSEIVNSATTQVTVGPTVGSSGTGGRGDICSVQLNDGTVLAIGGLTVDAPGAAGRSDASTTVIKSTSEGAAQGVVGPELSVPRFLHSCTLLADGSVLVLGGLNEQAAIHEVLQDAWIYQPAPTDP